MRHGFQKQISEHDDQSKLQSVHSLQIDAGPFMNMSSFDDHF